MSWHFLRLFLCELWPVYIWWLSEIKSIRACRSVEIIDVVWNVPESIVSSVIILHFQSFSLTAMSFLPSFRLKIPSFIHLPSHTTLRHVVYGIILGFSLSLTSTSIALFYQSRKRERVTAQFEARPIELRSDEVLEGVTGLIGAFQRVT